MNARSRIKLLADVLNISMSDIDTTYSSNEFIDSEGVTYAVLSHNELQLKISAFLRKALHNLDLLGELLENEEFADLVLDNCNDFKILREYTLYYKDLIDSFTDDEVYERLEDWGYSKDKLREYDTIEKARNFLLTLYYEYASEHYDDSYVLWYIDYTDSSLSDLIYEGMVGVNPYEIGELAFDHLSILDFLLNVMGYTDILYNENDVYVLEGESDV